MGAAPVVVLNGAPRSGKSSIAAALGDAWVNVGVDVFNRSVVPRRHRPGIGLRPGGERPDLEALLPAFYAALLGSVAAHSRRGRPVVVDVGVRDDPSRPLGLRALVARRLAGLPALLVGVRCPLAEIMRRRDADPDGYVGSSAEGGTPEVVRRWERAVHTPGTYDLEVDTSLLAPEGCAEVVHRRLAAGPEPTALLLWARRSA